MSDVTLLVCDYFPLGLWYQEIFIEHIGRYQKEAIVQLQRSHFTSHHIALWVNDFIQSNGYKSLWRLHTVQLVVEGLTWPPYFTAYVSWKGSKQHVYNGSTIMRSDSWDLPVWGPFEALVKSVHANTALSVTVIPICMMQANGDWLTEGLNNPPGSFPGPPLSLPSLALSKSSPPFSSRW